MWTGGSVLVKAASVEPEGPRPDDKPRIYTLSATFEQEISTANEVREATRLTVENLFEDVAKGQKIDLRTVRRIVHQTVDGVLRNPDAHVFITQLKQRDAYTAQHAINVCVLALAFGPVDL